MADVDKTQPPRRDLTQDEVDMVNTISVRIGQWNDALHGYDKQKFAERTASVCAAFMRSAELAGCENMTKLLFERLERLDVKDR